MFCSIFLLIYEYFQNKPELSGRPSNNDSVNLSVPRKSLKSSLIYTNYEDMNISYRPAIFVIILIVLSDQLINTFFIFNLKGLDFTMFELLFVCIIGLKMLKNPIYKHKKLAIGFILIFCFSMKTLSIIFRVIDSHKIRIFKIYKWIIPIGILSFIIISLLRAYNFCKVKWLFDFKFISLSKLLLFYGFIGFFFCLIISIIPNYIPCVDQNYFQNINYICNVTNFDSSKNSTIYYYENYFIFIKNLWRIERELYIIIIYLILILFKIILTFLIKLYCILIIKKLSPEYLICSNAIYYFIEELIDSVTCLFLGKFKYYKLYDILDDAFSILGTIFYLELIEFDFCGIDFNLKKNIKKRCINESKLGSSFGEQSSDSYTSNELENKFK